MNGNGNETAGRWVRVSTGAQDERDQEPDIDRWIADHGYAVGPTYRLHGKKASKDKHQKYLDQMLADMRAGKLTVLVVWYSARIERRGAWDHMNLAHMVKQVGGRIEYVKEPQLNEVNAFSNTFLAMHADLNKKFSDDLSMNVRKAFKTIDANGAIRNKPKFGHRIVGEYKHKTFEIIEREADVIRDAADWYLNDNMSLAMICRKLNGAHRLTHNGHEWSTKTLSQVLRSETVMGRYHQGTKVVKVPPILTVRQWKQLQAKLDQKAYRKGTRTRKDTAFLTSLLYCEHGHPLYRQPARNGDFYYERNGCRPGLLIPLDVADEIVFTGIMDMGDDPDAEPFTREIVIPGHNYQDDIDRIALDIQSLDPTAPDWLSTVTGMRADIDHLASLPAEPDHVETVAVSWSEFRAEWKKNMTTAERREFLISLGMRFIARKDGAEVVIRPARMPASV
jgi:DNA invertase Pin-like site-specific DNA recombinase